MLTEVVGKSHNFSGCWLLMTGTSCRGCDCPTQTRTIPRLSHSHMQAPFPTVVAPRPSGHRSVLKVGSLGLRESRAGSRLKLEVCLLLIKVGEKESLRGQSSGFESSFYHRSHHLQQVIHTPWVCFLIYKTDMILTVCTSKECHKNEWNDPLYSAQGMVQS